MNYEIAYRLAGTLYGNILHRNADDSGFNYYLKELQSERIQLKTAINQFYTSDEFCEKFVVNQTPNELTKYLLLSFFKPSVLDPQEVKQIARQLIMQGLPSVIESLLEDPKFYDCHGKFGIPQYSENATLSMNA